MDYYIEDQPLIICSEIENQQRMQLYQFGKDPEEKQAISRDQNGNQIRSYQKPRLRKVFDKPNNGLGLNSKRIGRSLYSLDESGNIIKQDVTLQEPD
jgi:hypothetical protein